MNQAGFGLLLLLLAAPLVGATFTSAGGFGTTTVSITAISTAVNTEPLPSVAEVLTEGIVQGTGTGYLRVIVNGGSEFVGGSDSVTLAGYSCFLNSSLFSCHFHPEPAFYAPDGSALLPITFGTPFLIDVVSTASPGPYPLIESDVSVTLQAQGSGGGLFVIGLAPDVPEPSTLSMASLSMGLCGVLLVSGRARRNRLRS